MFSQTAEYALRAVVWLAGNPDAPSTTHQIAKATRVPADYLAKVMQALGREGIVLAQRGKKGGFSLTVPAAEITILDVMNAVDPLKRIRTCPLSLKGHGANLCPLHRRLDNAMDQIERAFGETPIADLLNESAEQAPGMPRAPRPLCEIEEACHV
jgi:Rrf2 family protein